MSNDQKKQDTNTTEEVKNNENMNKTLEEMKTLKDVILQQTEQLKQEREAFEQEKENMRQENEKIKALLESQKKSLIMTPEEKARDKAEAQKTAEILNKDKILIKIPIDPQNPEDLDVYVQINGYPWIIKRGESVQVPVAVAELLQKANYI